MAVRNSIQKKQKEPPMVAVLVDTSTGWGRRLIHGIRNYAVKHGPWHLWVEPRGRSEMMRLPTDWDGHGVIARVSTSRLAKELKACRRPVINISGIRLEEVDFPRVTSNYTAAAAMAVEHFVERGYRNFAYVGPLKHSYVRKHAEEFRKQTAEVGADCHVFDYISDSIVGRRWTSRRQKLGDWLVELPKPISVFSWATNATAQLLDVCRYRGIVVPDEVAVLAGDDDDLICNCTTPPMSSVMVATEQVGYHAAACLQRLMQGEKLGATTEQIDPLRIVERQSTDALAIEDDELLRAVQFLRQHVFSGVTVSQLADAVPMSRRSLERKFQAFLGRTPLEEIRRLKLARARELLITTDSSIAQIAEQSGFGTPEYMTTTFKASFGITPLRFRSLSRAR